MTETTPTPKRVRRRFRDPRLWVGIAITFGTLSLAARGVDVRTLLHDLSRANLPLLIGLSAPIYLLTIWVRALRWRHLTNPVCDASRGALFRATAVGALANNVFPLRIGEVVRAFYLARETRAGTAALFGTVVLERGIDGIGSVGGRGTAPVERLIRHMAEGLGSLRGGRHLWWVLWHTVVIWTVLGVAPFLAAMLALGIDLGSFERNLSAAFVTLTAVGIAVALPSAPGFVGPYHLAAREALRRFGVTEELALALGTLAHAVFWLTTTGIGLAVLRYRGTRLDELADAASTDAGQVPS
ncbi:MAG: lysylphosphatidylglycerol synthase transmembrane domain-containing protein [Proteobacteria bacterium]|nr:lysylphosphatidylglycerol synthase transmembrane domain-containing protein [Pseudomonadota bacterium]